MIHNDPAPSVTYRTSASTASEVLRLQELKQTLAQYVSRDHADGIRWLLSDGENTDFIAEAIHESPFSSLHYAADRNKSAALMALIEKLPLTVWNMRTQDTGSTPLMLAAGRGNHEMALQLFLRLHTFVSTHQRMPGDVGERELQALAQAYGCETHEASVDRAIWRRIVDARDGEGNTPLLLAIKHRHLACSNMLLELTADPEIPNHHGESARSLVLQQPIGSEMRLLLDGTGPGHEQPYPVPVRQVAEPTRTGGLKPMRFARTQMTLV
jgi:hypothetical protein